MIKLQTGMVGRFKLEKYKADRDGNPIAETKEVAADWFDNLILDQGLNGLGTRSIQDSTSWIHVGSGSSEPAPGDSGLGNQISSTSNTQAQTNSNQSSEEPYYLFRRVTRRFSAGSAAGNLSEVGAGWGSGANQLFSRALILDAEGAPTSITVLSDEVLDVTYEIRVYPDITDSTGVVEIDGVVYDYIARAANINQASGPAGWEFNRYGTYGGGRTEAVVHSGEIGDVFSLPSGASSNASSGSVGAYQDSSFNGSASATWGLNAGNVGGVRSIRFKVGWSVWQIEFSSQVDGSPIPKDNTKELTLTVSHSWARRAD